MIKYINLLYSKGFHEHPLSKTGPPKIFEIFFTFFTFLGCASFRSEGTLRKKPYKKDNPEKLFSKILCPPIDNYLQLFRSSCFNVLFLRYEISIEVWILHQYWPTSRKKILFIDSFLRKYSYLWRVWKEY